MNKYKSLWDCIKEQENKDKSLSHYIQQNELKNGEYLQYNPHQNLEEQLIKDDDEKQRSFFKKCINLVSLGVFF